MRSLFRAASRGGARIIPAGLSALLSLSSVSPIRAEVRPNNGADSEFLTKVVPAIAASVKIIDYEVKHTTNPKVKKFAIEVLNQHAGSVKTATAHAKRLNVAVVPDADQGSKEMIAKLSQLKGADLDAAFLEWLSSIHHDTTVFDDEVKNGADPALKAYAKGSIAAGNGHLAEAHTLLGTLKR